MAKGYTYYAVAGCKARPGGYIRHTDAPTAREARRLADRETQGKYAYYIKRDEA